MSVFCTTRPTRTRKESERELTGYLLRSRFRNTGKPEFVKLSGYSKPGVLTDCDIPPDQYPLEIDGLTFTQIVRKVIAPFGLGLVVNKAATAAGKKFDVKEAEKEEDDDDEDDEDVGKTAAESGENAAAYLSGLAQQRNTVLSHTTKGQVYITTPNTKGTPILTLDFVTQSGDFKKIPGIISEMDFNAQGLHSDITVKQEADDEEGTDSEEVTIRNPLLPVRAIVRTKTHTVSSSSETTVNDAAKYELGKEIRENVNLTIEMGAIEINGKLIAPNNTIMVRDPNQFLYTLERWFIQSVDINQNEEKEWSELHCVLPFGYDFDEKRLLNVFVDPHQNLPRF
jgi:prophage tail gpP-like protein